MKKNLFLFLSVFYLFAAGVSRAQVITTYAGTGMSGYSGDGGHADTANLAKPIDVAVDRNGNLYIAGQNNYVIRRVDHVTNIITTVAGNDTAGYAGDGAAATAANIGTVGGLAVDSFGNIYFSDQDFFVIRKVNTAGIISTVAGNGFQGFSGDGGAATDAMLDGPTGIATDAAGNIYIADFNNNEVRRVNVSTGIISSYVGIGGLVGSHVDGLVALATLAGPSNLVFDTTGALYISEGINQDVRKMDASGLTISTVAGDYTMSGGYSGDGGDATAALLNSPTGLALDNYGNLYIADKNNNVIRRVDNSATPQITTYAGTAGTFGYSGDGGPATAALIGYPGGLAIDKKNNFYIADATNNVVRLIINEVAPEFIIGATQTLTLCQDAGAKNLNTRLAAVDSNIGQTETWSVINAPSNGTLAGFPYTTTSTGDTLIPTGLSYTATTGYNGTDSFTVMISDGTLADTTTIYVTVNPIPVVTVPADTSFCNNEVTAVLPITSSTPATIIWTNNNTTIGLGTTGSGNIPSFTANDTSATGFNVATISVTVSALGCAGLPDTFMISVKPTPVVTVDPGTQSRCNNTFTAIENFSGVVAGTTYSWINTDPSIGLAISGVGDNIPSFLATDSTSSPKTGHITVTPSANGCTGNPVAFDITVNPTPDVTVSPTANQAVCNGQNTNTVTFTSTVGTATYTWTNSDTSIGLAANGSGSSIPSFTATNDSTAPRVATIVVTPTSTGCPGNADSFTITVNPTPRLSNITDSFSVCSGAPVIIALTSATPGTMITWSRAAVAGIMESANNGGDTINEVLHNTTTANISVTYVDTLKANGCTNMQNTIVNVTPIPTLSNMITDFAICSGETFTFFDSSATSGTTFSWTRDSIANITGSDSSASGNGDSITEMLVNNSNEPIMVTYVVTTSAGLGCTYSQTLTVTVNPTPRLDTLTASVCDSALFHYVPSGTTGASYSWSRAAVGGVSNGPNSGVFAINERLDNTTTADVNVVYVYTITANSCTNTQDLIVTVHPAPKLTVVADTVCSGSAFTYIADVPAGTTYTWTSDTVAGVHGNTNSGNSQIHDTLTNGTFNNQNIIYVFNLNYLGCTNTEDVVVTVSPTIGAPSIITSPSSACTGAMYQNFGATSNELTTEVYTWSATNAAVYATGSTTQYALVNFTTAGDAVITVSANVPGTSCSKEASVTVNVSSNVTSTPTVSYFSNHFVCTPSTEGSYQWGYDDINTLDSTILTGEINQDYLNTAPDANKLYWVMTNTGGCMQKTYYTIPTGVQNVNTEVTSISIYPNPAGNVVNVSTSSAAHNNMSVDIQNMLGQKINTTIMTDGKASMDVSALASGTYIVTCYQDGIKIAASKFVKN